MEPAADAQPFVPFQTFVHHDFFHRMVTPPGLHLEKDELVPAGRDGFTRDGLRFSCTLDDGVHLQSAAVLWFPRFAVWQGHVQDIGDSTGADDVVVVEQVASLLVSVHGHVPSRAGDGAASGDLLQEVAELLGVEGVAESEEVREEGDLFVGEVAEGGEISGLVDL